MSVAFETSLGVFVVDVFEKERPKCSFNFLKLCKMMHYDYCFFHSVQANLVAQTGDPTTKGNGGFSIYHQIEGKKYFPNELKPKMKHKKIGLISMVNNGKNEHGSQFIITLGENLKNLDGIHTVFGEVAEGLDIIEKLNAVHVGKDTVPLRDVRIYHARVIRDPFPDPEHLIFPKELPEITEEQAQPLRIGVDEVLEDNELTIDEKLELEQLQEESKNAQILTVIGDLPSDDVKPPENVLFVCNLNPITKSEDLEVIFSQFGEIASCEVVRDVRTGNSLQYAFIEFEEKRSCEKAYFEMERVLIDDRRIHVDFSQSVSRQKRDVMNRNWRNFRQNKAGVSVGQREKSDEKKQQHRKRRDISKEKKTHKADGHRHKREDRRSDKKTERNRSRSKDRKRDRKDKKERH